MHTLYETPLRKPEILIMNHQYRKNFPQEFNFEQLQSHEIIEMVAHCGIMTWKSDLFIDSGHQLWLHMFMIWTHNYDNHNFL